MGSNKRKAPDEEVATSGKVVHREYPEGDPSTLKDSYYANLYTTKKIDFRVLSNQDAEFAAVYGS